MRRTALIIAISALVLVSCGGDDAPQGVMKLVVTPEVDGNSTTLWVGDELLPQLPSDGSADPEWTLVTPPDPEVLAGGDSYTFVPSDARGDAYVEYSFLAVGEGSTTLVFQQVAEPQETFTYTVEVNDR